MLCYLVDSVRSMLRWMIVIVLPSATVAFQTPCPEAASRLFGQLLDRWAWEFFWNDATGGFRYQPRSSADVNLFWNGELVGMCSIDIGSCSAYERRDATLGPFITSVNGIRGDIVDATARFLREIGAPRVLVEKKNPSQ